MGIYEELQERGLLAQVTNEDEIREMVNAGKAVFYIGFDCTADSLTAGHFMALTLMKRLQMAGNKPIALIGGGTTMIGDPSGRTDMRKMLTREDIDHNAACFKRQMESFIEFGEGKAMMVNNADWLMDLNYIDMLREVGACFSVNNMLRAECYKQRMEKGLSFLEFNYMIMQSYDFYYLFQHYGCNMQFGGDDQWSNMLGGTELIRKKLGKDAHAMTITLLTDSQGKKMGKTAGNAVWLDPNKTSPFEFYQYWRNVDDADVMKCIRMLTFLPLETIREMDQWPDSRINEKKEILAVLQGVTKEFPSGDGVLKVLKGVNLEIYKNEFVVVLGESGCGKSTMMNIVGGMDFLTDGTLTIEGKDFSHPSDAELTRYRREYIGFIFQAYNLMPNLTALENVQFIAELVKDPMPAEEAIKKVGLTERSGNYPGQMSGGQQQRVSIARAIVKRPKLILADEPTAALDYTTSIEVLSVIEDIVRNQGATVMMVTHNPEIAKMADRVVKVRSGRIASIKKNLHPVHAEELVW